MTHDEIIMSYDVALTKMHEENDSLKAQLAAALMDIATLERKVDSMRDVPLFNGNPD